MAIFRDYRVNFMLATAVFVACGDVQSDGPGSTALPIQLGIPQAAYPAVGYLSTGCTAQLVGPQVILTAARCSGPSPTFSTGMDPTTFVQYPTDAQIAHPSKDLLLLHLTRAPTMPGASGTGGSIGSSPLPPLQLRTTLPAVDSTCTAVGYGIHDEDDGTITSKKKRSATEIVESANSESITVRMLSGIADDGDTGGPLLCGGAIAGVATYKDDGVFPNHIRENYATIDAAWVTAGLALAPPTVTNSLYVQEGSGLWRVDEGLGNYVRLSAANWRDAASMTAMDGRLYVIKASQLNKVNATTGAFELIGGLDWPGVTFMAGQGSQLYIQQGKGLYKVDSLTTGAYHRLGTANWTGTASMYGMGGKLYMIQLGYLHKVDLDGTFVVLGGPDWPGATRMAGSGFNLYVTQGGALWKVDDLSTGARHRLGSADWSDATSMTMLDDKLYIIRANRLHRVDTNTGSYVELGLPDWPGATLMTFIP
jgi:hypothetical protein